VRSNTASGSTSPAPTAEVAARRLIVAAIVIAAAVAAFLAGRATRSQPSPGRPRGGFAAGYLAGREAAFSGFDGGWSYGAPYIITLRRGGVGITYRFVRRWPMRPGTEYHVCGRAVCTRSGAAVP